jgi:hypothetical protein
MGDTVCHHDANARRMLRTLCFLQRANPRKSDGELIWIAFNSSRNKPNRLDLPEYNPANADDCWLIDSARGRCPWRVVCNSAASS